MLQFQRLTALDPANVPGFIVGPGDATFVDVIHADNGVMGSAISTGTASFLPNGGVRIQPGCSFLLGIIPIILEICNFYLFFF